MSERKEKVRLSLSEVVEAAVTEPQDGPPPIPCTGCPEFDAVVYPSTPNGPEEYDSFCNAGMGEGTFLLFMEGRNTPEDTCPYKDLLTERAALKAMFAEPHNQGAPYVGLAISKTTLMVDADWYRRLRDMLTRADR